MSALTSNIDTLIESYDVKCDVILTNHFTAIYDSLLADVKNYAADTNKYGDVLSQHLLRTSLMGSEFLKTLGFSDRAAENFKHANQLHDLGKIHECYDPNIWKTKHSPTPQEIAEKRKHPRLGVEILNRKLLESPAELQEHPHIRLIQSLQQFHHECVDASGYEGLNGDKMGNVIKTICIIDAYDGDMIHRPHQPAQRTPEEELNRLKNANKYRGKLDGDTLDRFTKFILG